MLFAGLVLCCFMWDRWIFFTIIRCFKAVYPFTRVIVPCSEAGVPFLRLFRRISACFPHFRYLIYQFIVLISWSSSSKNLCVALFNFLCSSTLRSAAPFFIFYLINYPNILRFGYGSLWRLLLFCLTSIFGAISHYSHSIDFLSAIIVTILFLKNQGLVVWLCLIIFTTICVYLIAMTLGLISAGLHSQAKTGSRVLPPKSVIW